MQVIKSTDQLLAEFPDAMFFNDYGKQYCATSIWQLKSIDGWVELQSDAAKAKQKNTPDTDVLRVIDAHGTEKMISPKELQVGQIALVHPGRIDIP